MEEGEIVAELLKKGQIPEVKTHPLPVDVKRAFWLGGAALIPVACAIVYHLVAGR